MSRPHVIVPGIWKSDEDHWQTHWERLDAGSVRIAPTSWTHPEVADWSAAIDRAVSEAAEPPVLVAHSLGVLAVARWLAEHDGELHDGVRHDGVRRDGERHDDEQPAGRPRVAGAFLVAPPDPAAPTFPAAAVGFTTPGASVSTPTVLVASDDDPYCSLDRALDMARTLGADVLRVGPLGHVNVASGIGPWPDGRALLADFERRL